ncbi:MAG: hypothetical protein WCE46_02525 [Methanoregula sp.]|uniref:hypothetical protein n=1 Tax=Methanoregula sp. TaxID=2052170 RepID=UPI003C764DDB
MMKNITGSSKGTKVSKSTSSKRAPVKKTLQHFKSTGEVLTVSEGTIERFLEIIPEPEWIEWKKQRGEIIIRPPEKSKGPSIVTREDVLWYCRIVPSSSLKELFEYGCFIVEPPLTIH